MFTYTHAFSGFSVNDLEAAKKFYSQTLELAVGETPQGLELKLTDDVHIFIYPKSNHEPATFTILNFEVADIDQTVGDLKAKGIVFERYPDLPADDQGIVRGLAANRGPDIAWFKDPAGNILSVLQTSK